MLKILFSGITIFSLWGTAGDAADRKASSCNASQLPHFLVYLLLESYTSKIQNVEH